MMMVLPTADPDDGPMCHRSTRHVMYMWFPIAFLYRQCGINDLPKTTYVTFEFSLFIIISSLPWGRFLAPTLSSYPVFSFSLNHYIRSFFKLLIIPNLGFLQTVFFSSI